MIRPFHVIWRAFSVWWDQWFILTILNIAWFVAQLLVVTGPPATAVLFAMTRHTLDGDFWDHREAWQAFQEMFLPAWRWGALNILVVGVAAFNLLTYANGAGVWNLLRIVWLMVLVLWGSLNFFYWPFWLEQADKSMWTTYGNCGRFLLLNIWQAPLLLLVCILLTAISMLTTLPFTLALMVWLGLLGGTAIRYALAGHKMASN